MPSTGIIFALQTGVGILGNIFLLSCYIFMTRTRQRLKDIDLILKNLVLANCLVLLSRGIPQAMLSFGMKNFLDDFGCKLVFYLHRVARGMSLSATCILSCFQAIKISPSSPRWIKIKATPVKYTRYSITLCWTLHMLVNSIILNYITGPRESNNHTKIQDFGYCSAVIAGRIAYILISVIFSCIDGLFGGCMVCTSSFMAFILHNHKHSVLYLRRKDVPPKFSAETRATQSILILVSFFCSTYFLSSLFSVYTPFFNKPSHWLVDASLLMDASFPSLCPFVLISRDPRVSRLCFTFFVKINDFCKQIRVL